MVAHDLANASLLESCVTTLEIVLEGTDHRRRAWTTCCSNPRSPDEAMYREGNFDRWDVDQSFSVDWKMTMPMHFPKAARTQLFEKSEDFCLIVQNGSRSPQW